MHVRVELRPAVHAMLRVAVQLHFFVMQVVAAELVGRGDKGHRRGQR